MELFAIEFLCWSGTLGRAWCSALLAGSTPGAARKGALWHSWRARCWRRWGRRERRAASLAGGAPARRFPRQLLRDLAVQVPGLALRASVVGLCRVPWPMLVAACRWSDARPLTSPPRLCRSRAHTVRHALDGISAISGRPLVSCVPLTAVAVAQRAHFFVVCVCVCVAAYLRMEAIPGNCRFPWEKRTF